MFSWECPKCGHDNPPSAKNCIYCGYDEAQAEAEGLPPHGAQPHEEIPPPAPAPQASVARPVLHQPRPHRSGMPTWLMSLLFAAGFLIVGFAVYYTIQYFSNRPTSAARSVVNNAVAARDKVSNPLQKYIEVIGIRLVQDKAHRIEARFVVVNHATTELDDVSATVTLWASTAKSEEDPVGTFTFKIPNLPANDSKELSAPLNTKLKIYEMPDWQNLTADLQINAQ
ncbi:MAG TPA: hypothetical protein DEQ47_10775 [Solibacterales bacterium]|nr:hypothetical protein [Bryobacterales bacterium]